MTVTSPPSRFTALSLGLLRSETDASLGFQVLWLLMRLSAGGLMIHNGLDKLADVQGFADNVVAFIGLPYPLFFTYCAAYVEIVSAILLILGVLTRFNALALLFTMAVAIFFHIKADGLQITPLETATLYASFYLFFLINGAGKFAIDTWLWQQLGGTSDS